MSNSKKTTRLRRRCRRATEFDNEKGRRVMGKGIKECEIKHTKTNVFRNGCCRMPLSRKYQNSACDKRNLEAIHLWTLAFSRPPPNLVNFTASSLSCPFLSFFLLRLIYLDFSVSICAYLRSFCFHLNIFFSLFGYLIFLIYFYIFFLYLVNCV